MRTKLHKYGFTTISLLVLSNVFAQGESSDDPDFSGVWTMDEDASSWSARQRYPVSLWSDKELPFSEAGLRAVTANQPGRGPRTVDPEERNDPQMNANPAGLYRALIYRRPWEFVQTDQKIVQIFAWGGNWRMIYKDGRPVPDDHPAAPFWNGYTVAHWEGDTLVATTLALDERAWLDDWGTPFSIDARFEERWRLLDPDSLELTVTVNDPLFYTETWTAAPLVFERVTDFEPLEIVFAPMDVQMFNEDIRLPARGLGN